MTPLRLLQLAGAALTLAGALFLVADVDAITLRGASPLAVLPYSAGLFLAGIGLLLASRSPRGRDAAFGGFALMALGLLGGFLFFLTLRSFTTLGGIAWLLSGAGAAVLAAGTWRWRRGQAAADLFRVGTAMLIVGETAPVLRSIGLFDPLTFLLPLALLVAGLVMLAMAPPTTAAT